MSTRQMGAWTQGHRVGDDGGDTLRYEVTGLWTRSVPTFVEACAADGTARLEHRGGRTFVVVDQ